MQIQNAILTGSTTVYGPITFVSGTLAGSASYAATSSYADTFTVAGSLTAQTLVVQTITSSIDYVTGSTRFGSLLTNTHTFTGSLQVTGSGPHTVFGNVQVGNNTSIGTTTPVILSLGGTFNSAAAGSNVKLRVYEDGGGGSIGGMGVSSGQMEVNTWSSGKIAFYRGTTQTAIIDNNGNLGIGTSGPSALLHLSGLGGGSLMRISSTVSSSIFFVSGSGAVGIGTVGPWANLHIANRAVSLSSTTVSLGFNTQGLLLSQATVTNNNGSVLWFSNDDLPSAIASGRPSTSNWGTDLRFYTHQNATVNQLDVTERMRITGDGSVGIGLTNPSSLFHISGPGSGSLMQIASTVSSNILFVSGSGNVGIGTTDIVSTNLTGSLTIRKSYNGDTPNGATTQAYFSNQSALYLFGRNSGLSIISNNNEEGKIAFGNNSTAIYASITTGTAATSVGGDMYFKVGSDTERMRITSGGNIGIGTTSPNYQLDLSGGTTVNERLRLQRGSDDTNQFAVYGWNSIRTYRANVSVSSNLTDFSIIQSGSDGSRTPFYIGVTGNIGIGTTSPSNLLSVVQSNSAASTTLDITNSSNASTTTKTAQLLFSISDTANTLKPAASIVSLPDGVNVLSAGMYFSTRASDGGPFERMRITSAGNVFVGSTGGDGRLHVKTASAVAYNGSSYNGANANIRLESGATVTTGTTTGISMGVGGSAEAYIGAVQNSSNLAEIVFQNYDGAYRERMRITSAGNLLVGQTTPDISGANGWSFQVAGGGHTAFQITNNEAFIFNNRTTGTTYQIDFRTNAVERGSINVTDAGTTYATTSDYRVKEDFKDFNGLEKLKNIKVYDFKFKHLDERMDGVIAHELQEVIPYAVHGEKDGAKFQSVDYSRIVPVLVKSIQELSTKLEEATTRIKTLESK